MIELVQNQDGSFEASVNVNKKTSEGSYGYEAYANGETKEEAIENLEYLFEEISSELDRLKK